MRKTVLNKDLTLYFEKFFPIKNQKKSSFKHICIIGIGGNIGNVKKRFYLVFLKFMKDKRFHILQTSPILQNPPFGYLEQKDFLNAVLVMQTSLSPKELLKNLLHIEKQFKRERSFKNAPRSLDLDIIFYDDLTIKTKNLSVPHPNWHKRNSVIIPLSFIERIA
ncbi:MAG: 2-amino-4-hydroxy-6-hydroxymethyldihydropteridine diphosphokinase [Campylobacteraceae bacterium]|nr:2-amino-4-hydroxy-6-hydroxymethyldihydropteridine diphosphokinase [Campylobacteraceae bacterium]